MPAATYLDEILAAHRAAAAADGRDVGALVAGARRADGAPALRAPPWPAPRGWP